MKWKPYLTPVRSLGADEAKAILNDYPVDKITLVDVRQPGEYQEGHISGARLIPLPELMDRLKEIPRNLPVLVYCKSGARSRSACQLLAQDDSFSEIINLAGGFQSWEGQAALGNEDQGLTFFTGLESPRHILEIAYGLEQGLGEFYLSMKEKIQNIEVQKLFTTLAKIETIHQKSILKEYKRLTGREKIQEEFQSASTQSLLEGGMTTEEYVNYYMPQWEDPEDVVFLAMGIEAQALDMYLRAAGRVKDSTGREILTRIAQEEKTHLAHLGRLMDSLVPVTDS